MGNLVSAAIRAVWWDTFEIRLNNSDRKKIRKDQMKDSKADNFFYPYDMRDYTAPGHKHVILVLNKRDFPGKRWMETPLTSV